MLYGANQVPYSIALSNNAAAELQSIGGKVVRFAVQWDVFNPSNGTIFWSGPDSVYNAALSRGLKVIFAVVGSPQWVSGSANQMYIPVSGSTLDAAWLAAYNTYFAQVVARYPEAYFQIWNEQNTNYVGSFWQENGSTVSTPQEAVYRQLFNAAYAAGKAANATARIGIGGLAGLTFWSGGGAIVGVDYLDALMTDGAFTRPDFVAIHPYTGGSATADPTVDNYPTGNSFKDIGRIQTQMVTRGWGNVPLWVTEFGNYSAAAVGGEAAKATYMTNALNLIHTTYGSNVVAAGHAGVQLVVYYLLNNSSNGSSDTSDTGLFSGTPLGGPNTLLQSGTSFLNFTGG